MGREQPPSREQQQDPPKKKTSDLNPLAPPFYPPFRGMAARLLGQRERGEPERSSAQWLSALPVPPNSPVSPEPTTHRSEPQTSTQQPKKKTSSHSLTAPPSHRVQSMTCTYARHLGETGESVLPERTTHRPLDSPISPLSPDPTTLSSPNAPPRPVSTPPKPTDIPTALTRSPRAAARRRKPKGPTSSPIAIHVDDVDEEQRDQKPEPEPPRMVRSDLAVRRGAVSFPPSGEDKDHNKENEELR
ncbi:hypothetical protein MMC07_005277 [Pseudocyphellaria aurata]|nr:hypothetical protein [Pseudocyphellaria aurata]